MRELLFRAKAINRDKGYHRTNYNNGDFVYGLVTQLYDERFENLPAKMTDINGVSGIEVDYKTIGQFTGLTDKNGKKIFEGDIVKDVTDGVHREVFYCNQSAMFLKKGILKSSLGNPLHLEVIGNIHDNPELLENNPIPPPIWG